MRLISGHREVCLCGLDRCVPVGGGPPARSPHASLRLGVVDLEARPGPAAAHRHLGQVPQATRASRFLPCVNLRLGVVDLEARPSPPVPSTPVGLFIAVHIPSRPRRPRAPPPSSTARPLLSRSSRVALHTGGAWCAGGDRRRFEARPGPAPAHRHRSWAPAGGCMPCVGFQSGPLGVQH